MRNGLSRLDLAKYTERTEAGWNEYYAELEAGLREFEAKMMLAWKKREAKGRETERAILEGIS